MKKSYTLLLLAGAVGLSAFAENKFDAMGAMVMNTYKMFQQNPMADPILGENFPIKADALRGRADQPVSVIVKLAPEATASDLEVRGFDIISEVGHIVIAAGSLDEINALNDCDFVEALSFGGMAEPKLDLARRYTGADKVHEGTDLTQAYDGTGVLAGIFDSGLDPNHSNFMSRTEDYSRVDVVWHFSSSNGTARQYTDVTRFETDDKSETHGTHVLGCMAGGFNEAGGKVSTMTRHTSRPSSRATVNETTPNPYYGMAPNAYIAIGCGNLYDANIVAGAQKIRDYAKQEGLPAVLNLSLGGNIGQHDGTDLTSQALNEVGKDIIVCLAAGNEGDVNLSFDKTLGPDETEFITFITCDAASFLGYIDFWSDSSTPFEIHPLVFDEIDNEILDELEWKGGINGELVTLSTQKGSSYQNLDSFTSYFSNSTLRMQSSTNTGTNNRYNVIMQANISWNRSTNRDHSRVVGFRIIGTPGQRITGTTNAYCQTDGTHAVFTNCDWDEYVNGSPDFSISSMANFENCVVVGAWNTAVCWPTISGYPYSYQNSTMKRDEVAEYSSYGIDDNGNALPHVCAPGTAIVSSISTYYYNAMASSYGTQYTNGVSASQSYDGRNNYWEAMQGTSMACPVVAGGIALWLQANPYLTVADVRRIIKATADRDATVTGFEPAIKWGAGKFNVYEGLKEVLKGSGIDDVLVDNKNPMLITAAGASSWDITVPGAQSVKADLYNLQGVKVASASARSHNVLLNAEGIAKGVYIINVNGNESQRVLVK
ncbi:MAG: S8 family peptidase [Muribaculaceae bacterium]|nr:S8 family peptidase [Muribaculaceae bacterium]